MFAGGRYMLTCCCGRRVSPQIGFCTFTDSKFEEEGTCLWACMKNVVVLIGKVVLAAPSEECGLSGTSSLHSLNGVMHWEELVRRTLNKHLAIQSIGVVCKPTPRVFRLGVLKVVGVIRRDTAPGRSFCECTFS